MRTIALFNNKGGVGKTVIEEWIETAKELGREIPEPKRRLVYA